MEKQGNISYLIVLFLLSMVALFYLTTGNILLVYVAIISVTALLFSFLSTGVGFIVLLIEVLTFGFILTFTSYFQNFTSVQQYFLVLEYVLLAFCLVLLWLIFSGLRKAQKKYEEMNSLVKELQKYEPQLLILTLTEFVSRTKFILTGLKRRKEKGYLFYVTLSNDTVHTLESIYQVMCKTILKSIRAEYDLAGRLSERKIIVLLQNTEEIGIEVVINRFEGLLSKELEIINEKPYVIEVKELNDEILKELESKVNVL